MHMYQFIRHRQVKKVPRVPESILQRRQVVAASKSTALKVAAAYKKKQAATKNVLFKRAEKYAKDHQATESNEIRLARIAKKSGNFYVPAEPKLAFVIRIRGINGIHPRPRKALQLFRLRQINNGVFVRLNKATLNMLKIVEPYLIYKRGYGKVNHQRIALTENSVVEKELGPNFKYASNFLWPFKLNSPLGGWRRKYNHYNDGGDYGFRDTKIDALVRQML
ncbi:unnamed protein product [Candidula unifasciata]|uniref:60S ribosomal protein L7 n=1 Tax=Candidula unifasciata TaxID=100452 RepID=A0A8S3ZWV5_9EUPU|nr:unnamed protein product [Candidula unifasciata]